MRGNLISIHIADLHIGKIDPLKQYLILKEQFINQLYQLPRIDLIAINGDIFDHKFMANADPIRYALQFMDDIVQLAWCKEKATIVMTAGTKAHEADQLKLFYHYLEDPSVDIRIVETIKFEDIHGARVLCIPELYNIDESIYQHFFHESGWYDLALIHGTYEGSVYGNNVGQGRLLTKEDFSLCKGLCTSGHIHQPQCFHGYFYYCGSPITMSFAETGTHGFLISNQDLDTGIHYVSMEPIESFRYETIYLDQLVSEDPKVVIDYINQRKQDEGIDFIKVRFRCYVSGANRTIINNYYRNISSTVIEFNDAIDIKNEAQLQESMNNNDKYSYLNDPKMSEYEKFIRFVNDSEGYQFITVDKLTELLNTKEL